MPQVYRAGSAPNRPAGSLHSISLSDQSSHDAQVAADPSGGQAQLHFSPRPNRASEIAWRTWGPAAFDEAKAQDRPLLLGISAVWCHWCHVMDETSYSDEQVIRGINERFIPIRVDNDERPDVNRRYNMGGWPTTAFLTPDGEIIHGGTYIAPEQMRSYVTQIADVWRDKRAEIAERAKEILEHEHSDARAQKPGDLSWEIVETVGSLVRGQYDPEFGGFGRQPKFPQPKLVRFVLEEHRRHGYPELATMLHKTLVAMAAGGMYDQVEGGFFRYSTTREWSVPHYEKMLEDNAELLLIYAEAHRSFPQAGYDRIARDVIRWMDTALWRPEIGMFSGSQDADEHYYPLEKAERAKHERPFVDRRIYTGWNALAASAYFACASALGDPALEEQARTVIRAIAERMTVDLHVMHFDAGSGPQLPDLLIDLAACLGAALDAYETGHHPATLPGAVQLATWLCERLEDVEYGGFWDAPDRSELGRVTRREKPIEDGALAADALLRLATLTGEDRWRDSALRALRGFAGEYRQWGQFAAAYASAVARALSEPLTVAVVGPADDAASERLWATALSCDDPARALHRLVPERDRERLTTLGYSPERTAAYVCIGTVCSAPLEDEGALAAELARARRRFGRG